MGQKHDKKLWTRQEDECLRKAMEEIGEDKWNDVATRFNQLFIQTYGYRSDRLGKQCRQRWYNKLSPALKSSEEKWTDEQDDAMIDVYKIYGSKWSKMIQILFQTFSIRRSDNGVKNHFHTLIKKGMKELNQFIDQYNDDCKRKGFFEQKPKKKYFYPKQLSLEKQLLNKRRKFKNNVEQSAILPQEMVSQHPVEIVNLGMNENSKMQAQGNLMNDFTPDHGKESFLVKGQDEGTKEKLNVKEDCLDTVNTEPVKYLTPLKPLEKKVIDRLLFMLLDKDAQDSQYVPLKLAEEHTYLPIRNSLLDYIKHQKTFTIDQTKDLAEGITKYTNYTRSTGKRISYAKKSKKTPPDYSYLDIHRASRKLFEKIKVRFPQYLKAFSVSRHQILSRINVLVSKTRQRQIEMKEQINKKYFLRKDEEQIIMGKMVQEAVYLLQYKRDETRRKKQAVWRQKKILRQQSLQREKQAFIANGGTAQEFQSIQEEKRLLRIENFRLKVKLKSQQQNQFSIFPPPRRRISRLQVSKVKPTRKNKGDNEQIFEQPFYNPHALSEFAYHVNEQMLARKTSQKIEFRLTSEKKTSQNTFPFLINGIPEFPIESYKFFDDFNRAGLNSVSNIAMNCNPTFFDNPRLAPTINSNLQEVKQQYSQQLQFQTQQAQGQIKLDKNLIIKTEHGNNLPQIPVNSTKNSQAEIPSKKYPNSQLVFKVPLKRPLEEKHIQSQNSSHSLKSKKSIRPRIFIRQEQSKKDLSSSSLLKKSNQRKSPSNFNDSQFQPTKKIIPDFLAKSIQLAAQQNQLNRSWKFNHIQPDPSSPINSSRSNFIPFNPDSKPNFDRPQNGNFQFFKQLNNSQEISGPNSFFQRGNSINYNNMNKSQSIYKSCDFLGMSCENLKQPKVPGQKQNQFRNEGRKVEMNSFLQNIRKIQENEGTNWKEPKVYNFMDSIPEKLQKQGGQTPVSNSNKGFSAFNLFNSQPLDFEVPQKLIETAKNSNFPIRNYNDYSLNYQHANSMELSKVFEFDKKFGFNSARLSDIELFKSEDRNDDNTPRSRELDAASNMFKSQRIQSLHGSCGFLNKSRQLSNSCIYSNHDEKSIKGGKNFENTKNQPSIVQKMFEQKMEEEQQHKQ